jgi:hypothetical protein
MRRAPLLFPMRMRVGALYSWTFRPAAFVASDHASAMTCAIANLTCGSLVD